ncbi:hypothetical protein BUL40_01455 [Croceivirga radicis]|uniref:Glycosyl transferase n=2 Tax=Croceivirga radicis TaxID=1929488 RepID=A0A1V6LWG3_9FLAO|nr:hypothetical protein BUL40_01455 [Croceivirga radicis]
MKIREKIGRYYYGKGTFGFIMKPMVFVYDIWRHHIMDEKTFIQNRFKRRMGYELNLDNPQTLNEKIQWLKLYDRTDLHTICADKIEVRNYVEQKIGKEHLIPMLLVTENVEDITYETLPESPFIIKTNHDSGSYKIIKDKNEVKNWKVLRQFFAKKLKTNFYYSSKEWQYKHIPPKILVERLLQSKDGEIPKDYKVHCFGGKPKYIQLDFDRGTEHHSRNWYDENWDKANFHWAIKLKSGKETLPNKFNVPKPPTLEKILKFAEILSEPFAYARVDFYSVEGKVYFGEITFHHDSGFRPIVPKEWDYKLGEMVRLPRK